VRREERPYEGERDEKRDERDADEARPVTQETTKEAAQLGPSAPTHAVTLLSRLRS
jgi:hypothetical protein